MSTYATTLGQQARLATYDMAMLSTAQKNKALAAIADQLVAETPAILAANAADLEAAKANGVPSAMLDRLTLSTAGIANMISGVRDIIQLADPIGEISQITPRPSGIQVGKMRVPLGVVAIIYEARPNVTVDAAALCIKSGNACILRGGSEAVRSNQAIAAIINEALRHCDFPQFAVQVVNTTDRAVVGELITMRNYIDVLIPRGGKGLIERLLQEARVPMIQHLDGNCHVYVHQQANLQQALTLCDNAKTQRYGTCNTAESLLVDAAVAEAFLGELAPRFAAKSVEMRACPLSLRYLPQATPASEADYFTEYLAPIISVKIVANIDEAIKHINHYSSHHTDAIITEHYPSALQFLRQVDSSSVMVNASTRFADGFEYGLGAEIGISTDKIHARGPVGLHGLTSEKWIVLGTGQIRGG